MNQLRRSALMTVLCSRKLKLQNAIQVIRSSVKRHHSCETATNESPRINTKSFHDSDDPSSWKTSPLQLHSACFFKSSSSISRLTQTGPEPRIHRTLVLALPSTNTSHCSFFPAGWQSSSMTLIQPKFSQSEGEQWVQQQWRNQRSDDDNNRSAHCPSSGFVGNVAELLEIPVSNSLLAMY